MPSLPPYRVLFNNDTTNVGGCISPWRANGETFNNERLNASLEEAARGGADCIVHSCGLGWIPWWKSRAYPDHYQWWMAKTGLEPDQYGRYMLDGGDMVAAGLATCRRLGVGYFVSLRLNDVHLQEHYNEKTPKSIWVSRFYEQHLDALIDPNHKQITNYYHRRGLDWANAEVRAYKLALLRELVAYDVDGIELDFLRDHNLFSDAVPLPERARIMAEFVADVRAALDAGRPGRWLSVRIPLESARHAESGIDAELLHGAGVDIFNLSGWFNTVQRTEGLREIRERIPEAATYFEITHSTASHHYFLPSNAYGNTGNPKTADNQFYTTARLALQAGAHGISLFNFVYFRPLQVDVPGGIHHEPPFHVLRHLADEVWLARHPGHYHLGHSMYYAQLPRFLEVGEASCFHVELAPHANAIGVRLRVHLRWARPTGSTLCAVLNGSKLDESPMTHRFFGNPFDSLISPPENRFAFLARPEQLRVGANELELTWRSAERMEVVFLDLGVETSHAAKSEASASARPTTTSLATLGCPR